MWRTISCKYKFSKSDHFSHFNLNKIIKHVNKNNSRGFGLVDIRMCDGDTVGGRRKDSMFGAAYFTRDIILFEGRRC